MSVCCCIHIEDATAKDHNDVKLHRFCLVMIRPPSSSFLTHPNAHCRRTAIVGTFFFSFFQALVRLIGLNETAVWRGLRSMKITWCWVSLIWLGSNDQKTRPRAAYRVDWQRFPTFPLPALLWNCFKRNRLVIEWLSQQHRGISRRFKRAVIFAEWNLLSVWNIETLSRTESCRFSWFEQVVKVATVISVAETVTEVNSIV